MKVKDLIKFLKDCNQEAIVCFDEYLGSDTPTVAVSEVQQFLKGYTVECSHDDSILVKNRKALFNIVKLKGVV